jgi:hypothetical protein
MAETPNARSSLMGRDSTTRLTSLLRSGTSIQSESAPIRSSVHSLYQTVRDSANLSPGAFSQGSIAVDDVPIIPITDLKNANVYRERVWDTLRINSTVIPAIWKSVIACKSPRLACPCEFTPAYYALALVYKTTK